MPISLSSLSLKRYLFLLIAIFVLLLAGAQIGFIHYVQQQIGEEVQDKTQTLSTQAINMLVENLPATDGDTRVFKTRVRTPPPSDNIVITIDKTPGAVVDLGDGYQFVTGQQTQTVTIERQQTEVIPTLHRTLRDRVHQLNIAQVESSYAYSVGFGDTDISHQQIVQFNPKDSVTSDYFQWLTLGTIAVCLVGLVMAWLLARHISRPLGELSGGFNRLEKGELGAQVRSDGIQDVKNTLDNFNHMSQKLAELKQMEDQFQQQQQLAELGEVARGLAHTLRNPINTIGLSLDQMSQADISEAQREELALQARQKISHLDNTIKALLRLTASGIDRGHSVDINSVVADIIMELSMTGSQEIIFNPAQQVTMIGAESEIRAMIHTLIANAVEASASGQGVSVFTEQRENGINVTIVDEGCGLSDSIKEKLFHPHVSTKPEGAGMGLYIAKRLSRSFYNGDITLSDNQPSGCIARLTLREQE